MEMSEMRVSGRTRGVSAPTGLAVVVSCKSHIINSLNLAARLQIVSAYDRGRPMDAMAHVAILTLTTIFGAAAALGMTWLFLRGAFRLMQPANASRPRSVRSELVQGTRASAQQFVLHR